LVLRFLSRFGVVFAFLVALSPPVFAQGYQGLIAPQEDTASSDDPAGYAGVVAGQAPPSAQNSSSGMTPAYSPQQMTRDVNAAPALAPVLSAEELKSLSFAYSFDKNGDGVPDDMEDKLADLFPEGLAAAEPPPQPRRDGMLPAELAAKSMIDSTMSQVRNKTLSADARRQAAEQGYKNLGFYADGLRAAQSAVAHMKGRVALPAIRLQEQEEGTRKALDRIDTALRELKQYR
jgi:hypothetical protein